jgi:hypothetical protein
MRPARHSRLLLVVAVLVPTAASAAEFGTFSGSSLLGLNTSATASTPTIAGCDNFTGTTGATMAGRAVSAAARCGSRVWTAHLGSWTIQSNQGASSATAGANATLNTSAANCTAQVKLANLNTSGRSGGLVVSHNGLSNYLAAVMTDGAPDAVRLRIVILGIPTVLATATPTFAATNTLTLSRNGSTVTVSLNGHVIITHTLTSTQVTSLGSGARAGLFGGSSSVRFDDFVVSTP